MTRKTAAFRALFEALMANRDPKTPIDVADKLTKRALEMVKEAMK